MSRKAFEDFQKEREERTGRNRLLTCQLRALSKSPGLNYTPENILRINKKEFDDEIGKFDEEDVQAFGGRLSTVLCACFCEEQC